MLTSKNAEERIVALMSKGAKLIYHTHYHPEMGSTLAKVTLEHKDRSVVLSHREMRIEWQRDWESAPYKVVCPVADAIKKRKDIRQGYIYNSDYGPLYREMFEHINSEVPWWVKAQVDPTDEDWQRRDFEQTTK